MVQDNGGKKDGKAKKGGKARDTHAGDDDAALLLTTLSSLAERVGMLSGEVALLRAEAHAGSGTADREFPDQGAMPANASAGAILGHLRETANAAARRTGDIAGAVLWAHVLSPGDAGEARATTLRFIGDAARRGDLRSERESALHERAARIAGALGAQPRIVLARLLLTEETLTATELGTGADLTTGSLYHHLREMTHNDVLTVAARNRYALTPLGRRVLLMLLAAAQDGEAE